MYSVENEIMIRPGRFPVPSVEISSVNSRMRSEILEDKVQTVGCKGLGGLFFLLFFWNASLSLCGVMCACLELTLCGTHLVVIPNFRLIEPYLIVPRLVMLMCCASRANIFSHPA